MAHGPQPSQPPAPVAAAAPVPAVEGVPARPLSRATRSSVSRTYSTKVCTRASKARCPFSRVARLGLPQTPSGLMAPTNA